MASPEHGETTAAATALLPALARPSHSALDIVVAALPRNPYCSNEGPPHCGCKFPNVTLQPQWVASKPWSLWKTFLVCLLACLIATTLVVLVLYFVHFGKAPNNGNSIIIHTDGKSTHVTCIFDSASPTQSEPQTTFSTTPEANQSSTTLLSTVYYPTPTGPPSTVPTVKTTVDHEVEIEE
ncbi:dynactin-associated protein [Sorex araneus]|uniref:dynactin-associated protein n=1 Tax=Sorex araneus TaxID=42254 RepID=UPI0003315C84|nr:dynactin-associated protein [Sorex araneus]